MGLNIDRFKIFINFLEPSDYHGYDSNRQVIWVAIESSSRGIALRIDILIEEFKPVVSDELYCEK